MNTRHRAASRAKRKLATSTYTADPTSLERVLARLQPLTQTETIALENPVMLAFQKLSSGAGTEHCFHTLAAAINVTMILCEDIEDKLPEITALLARDGLMRTHDRFAKIGQWGFDALALRNIPPAIDLYCQLIKLLPPLQFANAMREAIRRMQRGDVLKAATS